eukprot:1138171-Pelagomonas_calceolata.AAC.9
MHPGLPHWEDVRAHVFKNGSNTAQSVSDAAAADDNDNNDGNSDDHSDRLNARPRSAGQQFP